MSNPLRDTMLKMIEEQIRVSRSTDLAEVVKYQNGVIAIRPIGKKLTNNDGDSLSSEEVVKDISIINNSALKGGYPEEGDIVYVDFIDSDLSKAIIIAVLKKSDIDTHLTGKSELQPIESQSSITRDFSHIGRAL